MSLGLKLGGRHLTDQKALYDALPRLKSSGYDLLQVRLSLLMSWPHLAAFLEQAARNGFQLILHLDDTDDIFFMSTITQWREAIALRQCVLHADFADPRFQSHLQALMDQLSRNDLSLALENPGDLADIDALHELVLSIDRLGLCLDLGHANLAGGDLSRSAELDRRLQLIHLHHADVASGRDHLEPDEADFAALGPLIRATPAVPVVLEVNAAIGRFAELGRPTRERLRLLGWRGRTVPKRHRGPSTKAILFDLGNTLVDYHVGGLSDDEKDILGLFNVSRALHRWDMPMSLGDLQDAFYAPWLHRMKYRSRRQTEVEVTELLANILPKKARTGPRIKRLLLAFHEPFIRFAVAADGAAATLAEVRARGLEIALISNSPVPGYCHDATLRRLGLLEFLGQRTYSYEFGARKPQPEIFQSALARLGLAPEEALMVGDSIKSDIEPALQLGIRAVRFRCSVDAVPHHAQKGSTPAHRCISALHEILDLLPGPV